MACRRSSFSMCSQLARFLQQVLKLADLFSERAFAFAAGLRAPSGPLSRGPGRALALDCLAQPIDVLSREPCRSAYLRVCARAPEPGCRARAGSSSSSGRAPSARGLPAAARRRSSDSALRATLQLAIDAAVALLEPARVPRHVEVEQVRAVVLEVHAFARGVGRDQDRAADVRQIRVEGALDLFARVLGIPPWNVAMRGSLSRPGVSAARSCFSR